MFQSVYLSLGSNIEPREDHLQQAVIMLGENPNIELGRMSSLLETSALGNVKQADFLNAALEIKTILSPQELLKFTQGVEMAIGRDEKGTGGPRPIDIDILLFGDALICDDDLTIPHPLFHERGFVLEPLAEIAPNLMHPIFQETVSELCERAT